MATTVSGGQRPRLAQRERRDRQDLVAVDQISGGIGGEAAISVSVVRDADVSPELDHRPLQRCGVGGSEAVIDPQPVAVGADRGHLGAGCSQHSGGELAGGAVGAVHDDRQTGQRGLQDRQQMPDVALHQSGGARRIGTEPAHRRPGRASGGDLQAGAGKCRLDVGLDAVFDVVGKLEAAAAKDLDAVVRHVVVAC